MLCGCCGGGAKQEVKAGKQLEPIVANEKDINGEKSSFSSLVPAPASTQKAPLATAPVKNQKKNQVLPAVNSEPASELPPRAREDPFTDQLLTAMGKGQEALLARLNSEACSSSSAWTAEPAWALHRFRMAMRCADALLEKSIGLIESKANTKGQRKGWSRITLGDLQNWTKEAVAEAMPDTAAREEIFLALKGVEAAASALWHGSMLELRCSEVPPASELAKLSSRSLAKLIGIVTAVSVNRVVFEAQESYGRRWECMGDLFRQLGLSWPRATVFLDPASKSLAIYLCAASRFGERKYTLAVRRGLVLKDALDAGHREISGPLADLLRGLEQSGPAKPFKVFPSFVDDTIIKTSNLGAALDNAAVVQQIVEKGEGHGPRKEFFALAGQEMCGAAPPPEGKEPKGGGGGGAKSDNPSREVRGSNGDTTSPPKRSQGGPGQPPAPVFSYVRTAGSYWIDRSLERKEEDARAAVRYAGWLIGQCLANRGTLGVPLPAHLFQALVLGAEDWSPTLAALREFDADAARALERLGALPAVELAELMAMEGLPPGTPLAEYLRRGTRDYFVDGVQWALDELRRGWCSAVDPVVLQDCHVSPWDLPEIICGPPGSLTASDGPLPDLWEVFRVSDDLEAARSTPELPAALRKVVGALSPEHQRLFLRFVTGSDRLPLPGTEMLKIEVPYTALTRDEHNTLLAKLPQAHTCDNTLEIPNYFESLCEVKEGQAPDILSAERRAALVPTLEAIMRDKIILAITSCGGYALDDRGEIAGAAGGPGGGGGTGNPVTGGPSWSRSQGTIQANTPAALESGVALVLDEGAGAGGRAGNNSAARAAMGQRGTSRRNGHASVTGVQGELIEHDGAAGLVSLLTAAAASTAGGTAGSEDGKRRASVGAKVDSQKGQLWQAQAHNAGRFEGLPGGPGESDSPSRYRSDLEGAMSPPITSVNNIGPMRQANSIPAGGEEGDDEGGLIMMLDDS